MLSLFAEISQAVFGLFQRLIDWMEEDLEDQNVSKLENLLRLVWLHREHKTTLHALLLPHGRGGPSIDVCPPPNRSIYFTSRSVHRRELGFGDYYNNSDFVCV